ncbi:maleylpyruvate isomerase family mycothiol-dependent enzyme [Kineococcus sp. NUM-3379]
MERDEVWRRIDAERAALADLLDDLSVREWQAPSLCADWTVRDVAAHLTLAQMGPLRAVGELARAGGRMNRMIRDTARRQAALPVDEFPRRLRAMAGSRRRAPGVGDLEPLVDVLVHGQDIAVPLGRAHPVPTPTALAAADRVWAMDWPFRARRRLRGLRLVATDADWAAGEGAEVRGPLPALLLLLTGRPVASGALSGAGAGRVAAGT